MNNYFQPIEGLWRFHVLYLIVTAVMGWAFFPYATYVSLLLVAGVCVVGLLCWTLKRFMAAHVLALAIGLGTPVVVLTGLRWSGTIFLFVLLVGAIAGLRKHLF